MNKPIFKDGYQYYENGHVTKYSDSSWYDEKCIHCGATDADGWGLILEEECSKNKNKDE